MPTHVHFGTAENLPDTGSVFPIGTAFLRSYPGTNLLSTGLIGVGKCSSISIKTTGELMELEDENGATEALLKLNQGEDLTIKARFTRDVPAPKDFQFISIKRRVSTLTGLNGFFTDADQHQSFLITEVSEDYGSKAVAEYSLTCRRWNSMQDVGNKVAVIDTLTGDAVGAPAQLPYPD